MTLRPFLTTITAFIMSFQMLSAEPEMLPVTSDYFQIEGRYQKDENGYATMSFPAVTTHVKFKGTQLKLTVNALADDVFLDIRSDDSEYEWYELNEGVQEITLTFDQKAVHHVEIVRRNEAWQGLIQLQTLETVDGGKFLKANPLPEKKLMFIGDSITCGSACDIREDGPDEGGFTHNGRMAYSYRISRSLNTQCHLVSYGGRGIIRDWQGNRAVNNAPIFYERTLGDDPHSKWDHQTYIPDAIGICLGTNDFSRGIPDQNEFVNAYVEFVHKLMRDAPDAKIFLIESPMFGTEEDGAVKRSVLRLYLDEIVTFLDAENVTVVDLGHYPGRPDNAHPLSHEHKAIAEVLAPTFEQALED